MIRLACPGCKKDSYTASVETFRPCPYCGVSFSGKYGIERRRAGRVSGSSPFLFSKNGTNIEATIIIFSKNGASIKIFGTPSISSGDNIRLKFGDSEKTGKVIWIGNDEPAALTAGLEIL